MLLSNYDNVMIYNKSANTYLGVTKKQLLVDIVNSNVQDDDKLKESYSDA